MITIMGAVVGFGLGLLGNYLDHRPVGGSGCRYSMTTCVGSWVSTFLFTVLCGVVGYLIGRVIS